MEEFGDTGFDWGDVLDDANARSGGEEVTASDVTSARRSFRLLTEKWNSEGFNTWRLEVLTLGLSGITPEVSLPDSVDDIINVSSIYSEQSETGMRRISVDEYSKLTRKQTTGQPSQWYLQRGRKPKLFVFPIGRTSGANELVIYYVKRPEGFQRYSVDDEVPGRWLNALVLGIAADMARKRVKDDGTYNEALITRLSAEAAAAEDTAYRADRQRVGYRARIGRLYG